MSEIVFSYAENTMGQMVHIDSVPNGLKCGCICPYCKEKLLARHGEERVHGFAHHSDTRGANLKICYMVIVYKLAEQIIQNKKRLHLPSYYGIFKESDIEFSDVRIDSNFERDDKQPDVIATTVDGKEFLIEFTFKYKVHRNKMEDYKNRTCIEIDLSDIQLDDLENFLLNSNEKRRWLNNQMLFDLIEPTYKNANKQIRLVETNECNVCDLKSSCCAIRYKHNSCTIIEIENSGHTYRICKTEEFIRNKECQQLQLVKQERIRREREDAFARKQEIFRLRRIEEEKWQKQLIVSIDLNDRTCFMCQSNLDWMCRDRNIAHCGPYLSMGVPKNTPPETAKYCKGFKAKIQKSKF